MLLRYRMCLALLVVLGLLMFWYHHIGSIPTSSNMTLRANELLWDHDQWVMDLTTQKIHRREGPITVLYDDRTQVGLDWLEDNKQLAVSVQVDGEKTARQKIVVDMWGLPTLLSGRYLIRVQRAELRAIDLLADDPQIVTVPIAPIQNSGVVVGNESLMPLQGTNRFVRNNFASGTNDLSLYAIEAEEIRLLSTWPGMGDVDYRHGRIYNFDTARQQVDVHAVDDGRFIESIGFPKEAELLGQPRHTSIQQDLLLCYNNQFSRFVVLDLAQKKLLKFPSEHFLPFGSIKSPYLVLQNKLLGKSHELLVYDRRTDEIIQKFKSPPLGSSCSFYDAERVYFHTHEHGLTATLVNLKTGREESRWSPFAWTSRSVYLLFPLMIAWFGLWCWASARANISPWLDVYLLCGLVAWMFSYPVTNSQWLKPIGFLSCTAGCLVIVQCAVWYLLMATSKLTTRLSICLMSLGLAQSLFVATIGLQDPGHGQLLLMVAGVTSAFLTFLAFVMKRKGWRLHHVSVAARPTSISDFFMITIACAIAINAARMTWSLGGGNEYPSDSIQVLSLPITLGIFGLMIGLMDRRKTIAALTCVAAAALVLIVGYRVFHLHWGLPPIRLVQVWWTPDCQKH